MQAKARVQINIFASKIADIKQAANLTDILIPVIWFEDGIDSLPESVTSLVRVAVFMPAIAEQALSYILFGLGAIILICVLIYFYRNMAAEKKFETRGAKSGEVEKGPANNGVKNGANNHHSNGNVELDDNVKHTKNGHSNEKAGRGNNGAVVESST
jgi:hypothetical protein